MSRGAEQMAIGKLVTILLAVSLSWTPGTSFAAEDAAEEISELLSQRFYEIEFFVFERSAVMDFNTREILLHKTPQSYPSRLLAMPYPDQAVGEHYVVDPMTLLCMSYPTLVYTSTAAAEEAELRQDLLTSIPDDQSADTTADPLGTDQPLEATTVPEIEPVLIVDPLAQLLTAVADFERELVASSNQWLPPESFNLTSEARQVQRRAGGRMLFHGRWLQAVPPRDDPLPVILPDTLVTGPGRELSGSVDVTLGRYLHFRTRLNYVAPALGAKPYQVALSPLGSSVPAGAAQLEESGFMTLAQSRRMRSEELHYLDHPKLGIVVRIEPVAIPETLLTLHSQLTEDPE